MAVAIALPLDSLLLRSVAARPYYCLRVRRRKHVWRHACPRDGLKAGLGLTMAVAIAFLCENPLEKF